MARGSGRQRWHVFNGLAGELFGLGRCGPQRLQLRQAAYEIDEFLKEFSTARIPIKRQVILNEAIAHLVANVLPNLEIAEMARVQVQLALRDYVKSAV